MRDNPTGIIIKPSNIRIWIHQKDLGRLQKVLWEGQGAKLRREHSNNPKVKRFLEAVPYLMVGHYVFIKYSSLLSTLNSTKIIALYNLYQSFSTDSH